MTTPTPAPPTKTQPYKAIAAFVLAFLSQLLVEVQGTPGGDDLANLSLTEWIVAIVASLVVAGVVWGVPNPAVGTSARRSARGAVDTRLIAIIALVLVVLVVLILVL